MRYILPIIFILVSGFSLIGAIFDWEWLWGENSADKYGWSTRSLVKIGRFPARIICGLTSLIILVASGYALFSG